MHRDEQPLDPGGITIASMASHPVELVKGFHFEAAHFLPNVPAGHKCRRMHGHSFRGEVAIRGNTDPHVGWLIDFGDIRKIVDPVIEELDHYCLNDIGGLENPTSELIAVWLWNRIAPAIDTLYRITIEETCSSRCHYFGPGDLSGPEISRRR